MANVIIPVGFSLGPQYPMVDPPENEPAYYGIQLGPGLMELDPDDAKVWSVAFIDASRHSRLEVTRATLERDLRTNEGGIRNPEPIVDDLLQHGLLLEFDPVQGPLEKLFRRYRLYPTGAGLGNRQDRPGIYQIGIGAEPAIALTETHYAIWSSSFHEESLWQACAEFANAEEVHDPGEQALDLSPEQVAAEMAAVIPMLVAAGAAFLDPIQV